MKLYHMVFRFPLDKFSKNDHKNSITFDWILRCMRSVNNTWGNVVKQCYHLPRSALWEIAFSPAETTTSAYRGKDYGSYSWFVFDSRFVYLIFKLHHCSTLFTGWCCVLNAGFMIEPWNRSVRHDRSDYGRAVIVCLQTYWPKRGQ